MQHLPAALYGLDDCWLLLMHRNMQWIALGRDPTSQWCLECTWKNVYTLFNTVTTPRIVACHLPRLSTAVLHWEPQLSEGLKHASPFVGKSMIMFRKPTSLSHNVLKKVYMQSKNIYILVYNIHAYILPAWKRTTSKSFLYLDIFGYNLNIQYPVLRTVNKLAKPCKAISNVLAVKQHVFPHQLFASFTCMKLLDSSVWTVKMWRKSRLAMMQNEKILLVKVVN